MTNSKTNVELEELEKEFNELEKDFNLILFALGMARGLLSNVQIQKEDFETLVQIDNIVDTVCARLQSEKE